VSTFEQSSARLIAVEDLGASQVAVVEETAHGALAVGISAGKPFAVSNRCRHLFASLGNGHVTDEGCLQCPWHAARYAIATGKGLVAYRLHFSPSGYSSTSGARRRPTLSPRAAGSSG